MKFLTRGSIVLASSLLPLIAPAAAEAGTLYGSNSQAFNTQYFASMNFNTTARFSSGRNVAYQESGQSQGGAYAHGPYGAYGVNASLLKHKWTIIANATTVQSCDIGFPSGYTCSVVSGNVHMAQTSNFGSSLPTSTSLPAKQYTATNGDWTYLQFDSQWTVRKSINGTVVERIVGNSNRHT